MATTLPAWVRESVLVVLAGLAGAVLNRHGVPVASVVDILPGNLPALMVAWVLGPVHGLVASVLSAGMAVAGGSHFGAVLFFPLEALLTGWWVVRRGYSGLTAAARFWTVAAPVSVLVTTQDPTLPYPLDWLQGLVQPVSGLVGAVGATAILTVLPRRSRASTAVGTGAGKPLRRLIFHRVAVLALAPVVVLTLALGRAFDRTVRSDADQQLDLLASSVALRVDQLLSEHRRAVATAAAAVAPAVEAGAAAEVETVLARLRQSYPGFITTLLADGTGMLVATSPVAGADGKRVADGSNTVADRDYYREPRVSGLPFISGAFRGRGFGSDTIAAVSAPVVSGGGAVIGVLEGSVSLAAIDGALRRQAGGRSLEAVVLDGYGRVVFSQGEERLDPLGLMPLPEGARAGGVFARDRRNRESSRPERALALLRRAPESGWAVLAQMPVVEVTREVAVFYAWVGAALLGAAAATVLLARQTARAITAPLFPLVEATHRLAAGETVDLAVPGDATAEIAGVMRDVRAAAQRLAAANQGLAAAVAERDRLNADLQVLLTEMEDKVRARTADLRVANAELERAARMKDEFLNSMSHELRTPLNAVIGLSQVLAEEIPGPLNQRQKECVQRIAQGGEGLLGLINDLLEVSRIEAGVVDIEVAPVSVRELATAAVRLVKEPAQKKKQVVDLILEPTVPLVAADNRRLKQVLLHLLANAVKFTPSGGRIGLEVRTVDGRPEVEFVVRDTGVGIAPEDRVRLFRPFAQLDGSRTRAQGGAGLGLFLVRKLARLHGAGVQVDSATGAGSRFSVRLLASEPAAEAAGLPPGVHLGVAGLTEPEAGRLGAAVAIAGGRLGVVHAVAQVLDYARDERPAAMVVDEDLAGFDAPSVAARLHDLGTGLIVVSSVRHGWTPADWTARALEGWLPRPWVPADLAPFAPAWAECLARAVSAAAAVGDVAVGADSGEVAGRASRPA